MLHASANVHAGHAACCMLHKLHKLCASCYMLHASNMVMLLHVACCMLLNAKGCMHFTCDMRTCDMNSSLSLFAVPGSASYLGEKLEKSAFGFILLAKRVVRQIVELLGQHMPELLDICYLQLRPFLGFSFVWR